MRAFYAVVLRSVEAHEVTWMEDWGQLESKIIDKPDLSVAIKPAKQETSLKKVVKGKDKDKEEKKHAKVGRVWFCCDFNTVGGRAQVPPHQVLDSFGMEREALHICSHSLHMKKGHQEHAAVSQECPYTPK